ncbi:reverse transcriptase family protein [Purpureocillium lavendulum]|uniref:Reverse transcriptase family protein n=1 Tax=Purpureocillium lavendulum TaxID=1247861 RepID=A0AB34FBG9_9HYPO|nr:reverse transcriptase family protein [Purpureocillium lavendulum]
MAARSEVTLSRPSEWTAWYEDFVSRAETSKIFDFVDIEKDSPTLEEPLEPLTSDEMLDRINKAAYDYWTMAMHTDAATAGPRPDPAADLTDAQWTRLGRLQSEYKVKLATFANRERAYAELAIWVRSTVDKTYLGNTTSKSDLRTIVRDLKSSLAPSEDEQKEEARLRYRQVLTQTKRVKPEDWLVVWNKAKLEGEKHKIAELEGQSAVNDFLTAVSAFDATWASQQKVQIMNSKKFGLKMDVTLRALGELFHEHIAINGESKDGRRVKPNRVKICKETLKQAKWKSLIDTVKASASTPKTDQQDEHESTVPRSRKHGDFVGLTIDANGLTGGHTDSVFAALREKHPLYNSTIYDCGATTHIVNDRSLLTDIRETAESDYVLIGEGSLKVEARGTRRMENMLNGEDGRNTRALVLLDVAYVPRFHTNIISARRLAKKGLWHCGFDNTLRVGTYDDNDILCRLTDHYDLDVVEYKPVSRSCFGLPQSPISVFNAFQDVFSSYHADGVKPIRQRTKGVRIKGPTTVQCTACSTGKATEIISRRESPNRSKQPFYRVFIDIFEFPAAYNTHRYVLLATDEFSGMMFSWSLASKPEVSRIIKNFEARIKRHTGASICKIRIDNERTIINLPYQKHSEFQVWAAEAGIDIELPPSHTKEPTGGAERPGGINQERMRCMTGRLPQELWPEFYRAAVWVHNILPSRRNAWMSPKEKMDRWFHQHFRWYRPPNVDFDATKDLRPEWQGIHAYGCKAYPLDSRYKAGKDTNQFKLGPRAHVGYLVGYHASNIYRIWVPKLNQVILSRDVRFNEEEFFDPGKEEQLEAEPVVEYRPTPQALEPLPQREWDTILDEFLFEFDDHILGFSPDGSNSGVEDAIGATMGTADAPLHNGLWPLQTMKQLNNTAQTHLPRSLKLCLTHHDQHTADRRITIPVEITLDTIVVKPLITRRRPSSDGHSMHPDTQPSSDLQPQAARGATRTRRSQQELYGDQPTRKSSRAPKPIRKLGDDAHSVFTSQLPANQHPEGNLTTFHSIFLAAVSKAARDHALHRDDLVRLPKRYQDLNKHPMSTEFKDAMRSELRNLLHRGTWRLIEREKARAPPLPLKWVYTYKFDQDGYLQRCKARICVRGDLQEDDDGLETYAATLAAKTFRVVMATAARFDLDIRQFDVGNAFLYSDLNKDRPVYVQLPKGYVDLGFLKPGETPTMVAELEKALYGLRESPVLWYNEVSQALKEAGINRTDEEPCVFTNGKILVLVYVDDILVVGPRQEKEAIDVLVRHLQSKYDLREEDFRWYLGIRVVRDRPNRRIYLCQDAYIDKVARKFRLSDSKIRVPSIPITTVPLTKHDGQASKDEIKAYQERVGSLMYVAVMTRPDISRAAAQLARFLTNPSPEHLAAANQCIRYLYTTRYLAIVYDGMHDGEALVIASDASFADDVETRRSSQGYVMMLFNGPVAWKAGLQDTVTTSTTEAEILSLERAAKESYALDRLLRDISLDLGPLKIFCDNLQSIRLVVEENQRITTKLRHVDIQNMWLKQEFRKADGLTKALSRSKFEHFRSLLNLVDIKKQVDVGENDPCGANCLTPGLQNGDQPSHFFGSQRRRGVPPIDPGLTAALPAGIMAKNTTILIKDPDGKFPCPHCAKSYLHSKHLKRHLLRRTFSRSDVLKRHFQKCSIRRGNPTGASHLSPQAHVKNSARAPKATDFTSEGNITHPNSDNIVGMTNPQTSSLTGSDPLFRSVANIRHTAVHRIQGSAKGNEQFLLGAEALARQPRGYSGGTNLANKKAERKKPAAKKPAAKKAAPKKAVVAMGESKTTTSKKPAASNKGAAAKKPQEDPRLKSVKKLC